MTTDDRSAPDASDPLIGRVLADRYRLVSLLALGGMSRVYRGRDERLERDVALKLLSERYAKDPSFVERFLGEARTAASMTHPSLVHVYDTASDGDLHVIVMELLDHHRSLRDLLATDGPLDASQAIAVGRELLAGLRVVHERGLVHCDVKTGNVMVGPGPAKLIDFGIARTPLDAQAEAYTLGSLPYMSPEQLRGEPLTPASDLFALGVVLYEVITGRLPFAGRTPAEIAAAHSSGRVRAPSTLAEGVPDRVDRALAQSLRADPQDRFRTAVAMDRALGASLEAADEDETQIIMPLVGATDGYVPPAAPIYRESPPQQPPGGSRRRRTGAWSILGTSLLLAAAAAVVLVVAVPLLQLGSSSGGPAQPSAGASAAPVSTPLPATVEVPNTIGKGTADAIEAATIAGLNWTVRCDQDPQQPEGIIDQEPPAGTPVQRGARFTMYSARIADCR